MFGTHLDESSSAGGGKWRWNLPPGAGLTATLAVRLAELLPPPVCFGAGNISRLPQVLRHELGTLQGYNHPSGVISLSQLLQGSFRTICYAG